MIIDARAHEIEPLPAIDVDGNGFHLEGHVVDGYHRGPSEAQVQGMHQSFEFHEKGVGTEASWCWTDSGMRWFAAQPGFRVWWTDSGYGYMPSFREYVGQLIRESEAAA